MEGNCRWEGTIIINQRDENHIHTFLQPMVGDLEKFGERVLTDLWEAVKEEFPEEETELDPLTQARAYHESFIESHARSFVGRSKILQEIHNYVDSVHLL